MLIFFLIGCAPNNENQGDLIHIDVSRSYPVKELRLEEVAEIEFLQLEMHDDFLFSGNPRVITESKIIFGERNGDILVFSRDGTPLSRFNRRGQGPGEFSFMAGLLYNEVTNEIFVITSTNIMVYSLVGEFKRTIQPHEGVFLHGSETQISSFDAETFLLHLITDIYPTRFSLISKKDGNLIQSIDIPRDEEIITFAYTPDRSGIFIAPTHRIVSYKDGFLLTDFSLDTVFFLSQNRELSPILVRTPAIQSMSTVVYLNGFIEAGNYQFFSAVTVRNENNRLPQRHLMRDKTTGSVYVQRVTFDDFDGREIILSPERIVNTQGSRLGFVSLDLTELQDANDEGRLSGRLREIVENSEEDGNNVFMLLHFK